MEVTFVPGLQLSIAPENPIVCFGENFTEVEVQINGGLAPFEIIWSDGTMGSTANLPAGAAWVTVNDATNCPLVTYNFQVDQITQQPGVNAGSDMLICSGSTELNLQGAFANADGAQWSGGEGVFLNPINQLNNTYVPTPNELASGFSLILTTIDLNGCPLYADTMEVEMGLVDFNNSAVVDQVLCFGYSDGSIQLNTSGLSQPFSYSWSNGMDTPVITNLAPGNYAVTITDVFGCDTTFTYLLNAPLEPTVQAGNDVNTCSGISELQLQGIFANADGAQWTGGSGSFLYPVISLTTPIILQQMSWLMDLRFTSKLQI